jgi:DNA-directed RNA polymerase specialized sigma24 family protein
VAPKGASSRKWTDEEVRLLHQLALKLSPFEIARALNRSVAAVRTKAAHQRVSLRTERRPGPARAPYPWEVEP